jgi:predicted DCC family thiol-disulfide oxidoreductase YuxK
VAHLLYDSDCGVCTCIAALLLRLDRRGRLDAVAISSVRGRTLLRGMPRARRLASWHLVDDRGGHSSGSRAVFALAAIFAPDWVGTPGRAAARLAATPLALAYRPLVRGRSALGRIVSDRAVRRAREVIRAH